ncbi:Conserved_hypothetical protein [Hexamita inflata]|uniref:Transmembrane protein n=1 Tax=Hexamita inflata TaxID=28002 RepID=A0AA86R3S0_9EUKA|nr:Conserved hypothetical protein [Hexamita inflata]
MQNAAVQIVYLATFSQLISFHYCYNGDQTLTTLTINQNLTGQETLILLAHIYPCSGTTSLMTFDYQTKNYKFLNGTAVLQAVNDQTLLQRSVVDGLVRKAKLIQSFSQPIINNIQTENIQQNQFNEYVRVLMIKLRIMFELFSVYNLQNLNNLKTIFDQEYQNIPFANFNYNRLEQLRNSFTLIITNELTSSSQQIFIQQLLLSYFSESFTPSSVPVWFANLNAKRNMYNRYYIGSGFVFPTQYGQGMSGTLNQCSKVDIVSFWAIGISFYYQALPNYLIQPAVKGFVFSMEKELIFSQPLKIVFLGPGSADGVPKVFGDEVSSATTITGSTWYYYSTTKYFVVDGNLTRSFDYLIFPDLVGITGIQSTCTIFNGVECKDASGELKVQLESDYSVDISGSQTVVTLQNGLSESIPFCQNTQFIEFKKSIFGFDYYYYVDARSITNCKYTAVVQNTNNILQIQSNADFVIVQMQNNNYSLGFKPNSISNTVQLNGAVDDTLEIFEIINGQIVSMSYPYYATYTNPDIVNVKFAPLNNNNMKSSTISETQTKNGLFAQIIIVLLSISFMLFQLALHKQQKRKLKKHE